MCCEVLVAGWVYVKARELSRAWMRMWHEFTHAIRYSGSVL